jgi:hypothetical protein
MDEFTFAALKRSLAGKQMVIPNTDDFIFIFSDFFSSGLFVARRDVFIFIHSEAFILLGSRNFFLASEKVWG